MVGRPKVDKEVRAAFGRRLQKALIAKGWNQSDLARHAAVHMPDNRFGRDNVSKYINGLTLPAPLQLSAISRALDVPADELLPENKGRALASHISDQAPKLSIRDVDESGERAFLRINQEVPMDVAIEIMALLKKAKDADR